MTQSITPDHIEKKMPKILLVDDENLFRDALKKELILRGYQVIAVRSGGEAIPVIRRTKPEVVILDQMMPVMDGFQALKKIKKIHPAAQVIMLTGYGGAEAACEAGKPHIFKCLKKPCGVEEIVAAIEAAVRVNAHVSPFSLKQWIKGFWA